jgi:lantibiotic biosynthesis protein
MAYVPIGRFLFRAPLLAMRALTDTKKTLLDYPLGAAALALASPDLAGGSHRGSRAKLALDRYRRRAAFRPTPAGLLAGVGVGHLAAQSRIRTESPTAVWRVSWERLASLGRSLLEVPEIRDQVRLRRAPSVLQGAHTVAWLGPGDDGGLVEERRTDLDDLMVAVLDATWTWTPWPSLRTAVAASEDQSDVDDLFLTMIHDGLLHVDVIPPLVGPDPADWMRDRLAVIPEARLAADTLAALRDAACQHSLHPAGVTARVSSESTSMVAGLDATLVFPTTRVLSLSRAAIGRAAALAPLLFRLQEALAAPVAERTPCRALAEALDATTEIFGAGALDLGAFALGDYGVDPAGADENDRDPVVAELGSDRRLTTVAIDRIADAIRNRLPEVALQAKELDPLLPSLAAPPTCELFVTPCRSRPGKPAGHGWLLGLHAPAGSSWGRFAFALGASATSMLATLRDAELLARPGETAVDVIFSPSDALADICAHPPLRRKALALTGWPADDQSALEPADLELFADAAAIEPLALRIGTSPITPSPLHRVRSSTAPPGIWRLLIGWSLYRQHAPWALTLGPFGDLAWTPRVSIDGFVVAPASWRIPAAVFARGASRRSLQAWRQRAGVPRFVQVGSEDELLPVDLTAPSATLDLAGKTRVFEIWPPLGDTPDESGRRLEAVVALVDDPSPDERVKIEAAIVATAEAGQVPPPRRTTADPTGESWRTFKLFGATDRQDLVLTHAVRPAIQEARDAREISGWFFVRYVDPPGNRAHLRIRVRLLDNDVGVARRLDAHLGPAVEAGDVVGVERTSYFPEAARFGGPRTMPVVHALFEADSDLACSLLAALGDPAGEGQYPSPPDDRLLLLVTWFDVLAAALGLDPQARREVARRRRAAHASEVDSELADDYARTFRVFRPELRKLLSGRRPPPVLAALSNYESQVAKVVRRLDKGGRDHILPPLLHLAAVRLAGPDRLLEIQAYTFWERTLESLGHHGSS